MHQHTLEDVARLARDLMDEFGLKGWSFHFTARGKRWVGICKHNKKYIGLSEFHALNDKIEQIEETIRHEIAHAIAGPETGHGPKWKEAARRVGCQFIEKCGRDSSIKAPPGSWYAICSSCLKEHNMYRKPRRSIYWCGQCGPVRGKLEFVPRPTSTGQTKPVSEKFKNMFG